MSRVQCRKSKEIPPQAAGRDRNLKKNLKKENNTRKVIRTKRAKQISQDESLNNKSAENFKKNAKQRQL